MDAIERRVSGGTLHTDIVATVSSANTLRFDCRDRRTTDFIPISHIASLLYAYPDVGVVEFVTGVVSFVTRYGTEE